MPVTRQQIASALRSMGVQPGELLMVHASYTSIGGVEGGPQAVARALVDAVSPGGSVFMPTFNYGRDAYDPATSPSLDGVITEEFRKLPGAVRSLHPTHSIAGIGPEAAAIVQGHEDVHAFAAGSPVWRLWERDAWVLLIGVVHFANSMAHVAEELLAMPYLDRQRVARVVQPDGSVKTVTIRRPGCSDAWHDVLDPPLRTTGAIIESQIGNARLMLMRAVAVVETTAALLRADPSSLLCSQCACEACGQARQLLR